MAVDADPTAVGLHLADTAIVIPVASDPRFAGALLEVVDRTRPQVLLSTVAEELTDLAALAPDLRAHGTRTWLPRPEAVTVCLDKWKFFTVLRDAGIPTPDTALGNAAALAGPWVVKPRFGRGSRGVSLVEDPQNLAAICRQTTEPIVQNRLNGHEFTADVLVARDGHVAACVPRWRAETKGGISTKGETFADAGVDAVVTATVQALGLDGVCNLQGFVDGGQATVLEVNPRFSGGLPLTLAAGADLVGEFVHGTLGFPLDPARLSFRSGVRMARYLTEIIEG
ncbi:MAG TPA: ATP-grasp domain-containing protein [Acidimicrobiia bacterium]|nr:ATP-grasp domain-containing protein [Acidimicrobiia bacterium]